MASEAGRVAAVRGTMALENILTAFAVLNLMCAPAAGAEIRSVVFDKNSSQLSVVEGFKEDFVAWANFTDDIQTSGWVWL